MLEFFSNFPPFLTGIEACLSAHHCGRELQALGHAGDADVVEPI